MKSLNRDQYQKLTVMISKETRDEAKALAKSHGMSFQGWLGQLIKQELKAAREAKEE